MGITTQFCSELPTFEINGPYSLCVATEKQILEKAEILTELASNVEVDAEFEDLNDKEIENQISLVRGLALGLSV